MFVRALEFLYLIHFWGWVGEDRGWGGDCRGGGGGWGAKTHAQKKPRKKENNSSGKSVL